MNQRGTDEGEETFVKSEWVERELRLYFDRGSLFNEINDRLEELKEDYRYPQIYVDDVLGRICFYVPNVEDEAIRRESTRESLERALERLNSDYIILSNAIESLTFEEKEALRTWYYGKGSNEVKTLYRAFRRFKMFMLIHREKKRKQQELEYQLQIMKENGLEHTPKGRKLLKIRGER
jgi:hypothetical protein